MQIVLVEQSFQSETRRLEPGALGASPVAMYPAAFDFKGERRRQQPQERPADAVILDVGAVAGMLEARHRRQDQFVHHRRVVERKGAGKEPIADNAVRESGVRHRDHGGRDQPHRNGNAQRRLLHPSPEGAEPARMHEHENLMPRPSKRRTRRERPVRCEFRSKARIWEDDRAGRGCHRRLFSRSQPRERKLDRARIEDLRQRAGQHVQGAALIVQV